MPRTLGTDSLIHLNLASKGVGLFPKLGKTLENRGIKEGVQFDPWSSLWFLWGSHPWLWGWEEEGSCMLWASQATLMVKNSPANAEWTCMLHVCALLAVHHECRFSLLMFSSECRHYPDLDAQIPASPGQSHHFLSRQCWCTQRNIWIWTKLGQRFEPLISHISTLAPERCRHKRCRHKRHKRCRFYPWVGKIP